MEIKETATRYEAPQSKTIELVLGSGTICTVSATEKLKEEEGEW